MARPRLNIEQDIIIAMHEAARHGYPVVHVWQIEMWMEDVPCTTRTLHNHLQRMAADGKVKKYHYRAYTLPDRKTLRQKIQAAHKELRDNSKAKIAGHVGVSVATVTKYTA